MKKRVLLCGGGTGGSVTPLLAVADHLQHSDPSIELLFVGSTGGPEADLSAAAGVPFQAIPSGKLRRYWSWKNFTDIRQIWLGWRAAQRLINTWRPNVVVSAGSYVAVPVVWAARRAGCRVIIHQQDLRPGLANRLMAAAADCITVAFPKSLADFPAKKVRLIGNPVRADISRGSKTEAQKIFNLEAGVPTLLVVGGGTGSVTFNSVLTMTATDIVHDWNIIHLTGSHHQPVDIRADRYHRYSFLTHEYPHALAAADLVLTRAGLGAISELAALGKPAIFVPLSDSHQLENAAMITDHSAGAVVPQHELTAARFLGILERFRREPDLGRQWSTNIRHLSDPAAANTMGDIIMNYLHQ